MHRPPVQWPCMKPGGNGMRSELQGSGCELHVCGLHVAGSVAWGIVHGAERTMPENSVNWEALKQGVSC